MRENLSPIGVIALDVDGTITHSAYDLDPKVKAILEKCIDKGWKIIFLTGRTFGFARPLMSQIERPFALGVQNGAELLHMPTENTLFKSFLSAQLLPFLEGFFKDQKLGFLIEMGHSKKDICYYRESDFSKEDRDYFSFRQTLSSEKWIHVPSFEALDLEEFAVVKVFASKKQVRYVQDRLKDERLSVLSIRDPFRPGYFLVHITAKMASKEAALASFLASLPTSGPLIVAGDDINDEKMLQRADIAVVMQKAPQKILELGDVIANDIVRGLSEALNALT